VLKHETWPSGGTEIQNYALKIVMIGRYFDYFFDHFLLLVEINVFSKVKISL